MRKNEKAMVLASFAADSLALGVHWIYDTNDLRARFNRVEELLHPHEDSHHTGKKQGDFTHYGDQTFVLLQSAAAKKSFDLEHFFKRWLRLFKENEKIYFDHATKDTLGNQDWGADRCGSFSDDLAGASRIAPLVYYVKDIEELSKAARAQTKMTHNSVTTDAAEFFARIAHLVLKGIAPTAAMSKVSEENFKESKISDWVEQGMKTKDQDTVQTILGFGQNCHIESAFPSVVHIISKYEKDLKEGLIENVMAGGDSAGRGMIIGMVLGAHLGMKAIPKKWLEFRKRKQIEKLLH